MLGQLFPVAFLDLNFSQHETKPRCEKAAVLVAEELPRLADVGAFNILTELSCPNRARSWGGLWSGSAQSPSPRQPPQLKKAFVFRLKSPKTGPRDPKSRRLALHST